MVGFLWQQQKRARPISLIYLLLKYLERILTSVVFIWLTCIFMWTNMLHYQSGKLTVIYTKLFPMARRYSLKSNLVWVFFLQIESSFENKAKLDAARSYYVPPTNYQLNLYNAQKITFLQHQLLESSSHFWRILQQYFIEGIHSNNNAVMKFLKNSECL